MDRVNQPIIVRLTMDISKQQQNVNMMIVQGYYFGLNVLVSSSNKTLHRQLDNAS